MHLAAKQHSLRALSLLLAGGANVNVTDEQRRTPLHAACGTCHDRSKNGDSNSAKECVELLLSSGALENVRDTMGQTPLHLAALTGDLGAVQALLAAGATGTADAKGNFPLHLAAAQGHVDVLQLLVPSARPDSIGVALNGDSSAVLLGHERPSSHVADEVLTEGPETTTPCEAFNATNTKETMHSQSFQEDRVSKIISKDDMRGWTAFQTHDKHTYYQNNATGETSWEPPIIHGNAEHRAQAQVHDDTNNSSTANSADAATFLNEPGTLLLAPCKFEPTVTTRAVGDDDAAGGDLSACRALGLLQSKKKTVKEEGAEIVCRQGPRHSYDTQDLTMRFGQMAAADISAPAKIIRSNWNGSPGATLTPHRRHDCYGNKGYSADADRHGQGALEMRNRYFKSTVQDASKLGDDGFGKDGDGDDGMPNQLEHRCMRRAHAGKAERRHTRSFYRKLHSRDNRITQWPDPLSPEDYEQVNQVTRPRFGQWCCSTAFTI